MVAILAPETARPLGENVVGEVCVAGPHVSPGLWAPDCAGRIRPHDGRMVMLDGTPYLRSGDMGMMIQGELHVVGRIKDMIIVRGANIYAEDIEHALLEQPEAADLVAAAAVAVERDEAEMLVLLCELSTGARAGLPVTIAETLRRRVAEATGLMPGEMVLLPPRSLPRTTSGTRRASCITTPTFCPSTKARRSFWICSTVMPRRPAAWRSMSMR